MLNFLSEIIAISVTLRLLNLGTVKIESSLVLNHPWVYVVCKLKPLSSKNQIFL